MTWPDRNKYVGEWKADERNGQGTLTFPDGNSFVGEWKDDKRNGQGIFYAGSSILMSGIWAQGKYVGRDAGEEAIAMKIEGNTYFVLVRFNGVITLNAVIDSGATDVSIPSDVVSTLMRSNSIREEDFLGLQTYLLADGSKVPSPRFRIRSLQVGNKTVENVTASVASAKADILLGQSFLSKFKSWSIDNERHELVLR